MPDITKFNIGSADNFVPFEGDEVVEGDPQSMVHWLRRGGPEINHGGGLYSVQPGTVKFTAPFNETLYMAEGEAEISISDGRELKMVQGDLMFLPGGSEVTWKCLVPHKLLFIGSR